MKIKYLALSLALLIAGIGSAHADRLVIKGSDTLGAKLVPQLAEQFKAQHPGTTFDIAARDRPLESPRSLMGRHKSACRAGGPKAPKSAPLRRKEST